MLMTSDHRHNFSASASRLDPLAVWSPEDPATPLNLAGTKWQITQIAARVLTDVHRPQIAFDETGFVQFRTACSAMMARFIQDEWTLFLGPSASIGTGQASDITTVDQRLLAHLSLITRFHRDEHSLAPVFETWDGLELRTRVVIRT